MLDDPAARGLEHLRELARHHATTDAARRAAAETGDLVGERVVGVGDDRPPLHRQKTSDDVAEELRKASDALTVLHKYMPAFQQDNLA